MRAHSLVCGQCPEGVDARALASAKTPAIHDPFPIAQPARENRLFARSVIPLVPQCSSNEAEPHLWIACVPLLCLARCPCLFIDISAITTNRQPLMVRSSQMT